MQDNEEIYTTISLVVFKQYTSCDIHAKYVSYMNEQYCGNSYVLIFQYTRTYFEK